MNTPNKDSAAFPCLERGGSGLDLTDAGMTLRQYAAIKLQVPDSGIAWLDVMITKAKRDELAAKAMQALVSTDATYGGKADRSLLTKAAYAHADAILNVKE